MNCVLGHSRAWFWAQLSMMIQGFVFVREIEVYNLLLLVHCRVSGAKINIIYNPKPFDKSKSVIIIPTKFVTYH